MVEDLADEVGVCHVCNHAQLPAAERAEGVFKLVDGKIIEMREYQDSTLCERVLGPFPVMPY